MSLATRAIIAGYRAELSTRPDGQTRVMDACKVTHEVVDGKTCCGLYIHIGHDRPMFGNKGDAVPTWDDVNCMTCLTKEKS